MMSLPVLCPCYVLRQLSSQILCGNTRIVDCRGPGDRKFPSPASGCDCSSAKLSLISDSASFRLESFTLDQQLCKRVCRGLKTGAIEHNFVRLTKEQVSSGGFSLLCAAQCPDPSHHNTLSAERRPDQSILKFKQPVDAQLLQ